MITNYISDYHRSGWKFIVNALSKYAITDSSQQYLILDPYIDNTFRYNDIIQSPYIQDIMCKGWIGILHHPPSNSIYSTNYDGTAVGEQYVV